MQSIFSVFFALLFTVSSVVDGDTIKLSNGETVRLIGVDAPESRNAFKKKKAFFGDVSKHYLDSLLTGKKVRLEYDITRKDRYGRTLAYVYLEDGTFINEKLVREGYATIMTVPPNVRYADHFFILQQRARDEHCGLWANNNLIK